MNAKHGKDRKNLLRVDNAANAVVIAAGLLVVLYAAAIGEPVQAPAPQVAQHVPLGRLVVTAQRPKDEKETVAAREAGHWDSARITAQLTDGRFVTVAARAR